MSRKLVSHVHVVGEDGFTPAVFGPEDEVPEWAAEQMGDHCFEAVDDVDGDGPIPAKSAPKADWVAYAVAQGADGAEAEATTKDDLVATYGKQ